jgi:hypothetical protein
MPEHNSKRPRPGRRLGFLGLGLNRVYSIAPDGVGALSRPQPTERKSSTLGLNAPGDPDDAITWQSSAE